ncbi:MAG: bifunctional folylpolyglutamate synthase/dihydrofolate synthase [Alistipes sp.]|nr:bifunctional folylpolyglutamate synthase/dihydrofolate synthase [Candidatus Minthomonas equi]
MLILSVWIRKGCFYETIMMDVKQYKDAVASLYEIAPSFQNVGQAGYKPGLQNMIDFDALPKHPHHSFKTIHVAGTNGKGSVAHMIAAILAASGYRTGLYTSPHLMDFRERIKVMDRDEGNPHISCSMISQEDVLSFLSSADSFISANKPSFFEITTAMAFDWFRSEKVDFAVVECGLGGRFDSTNVITPELSVITTIGYDHKDILGDTLSEIAFEKAGIIKPFVPVVIGEMPHQARRVIQTEASKVDAPSVYVPVNVGNVHSPLGCALMGLDVSEMDLKCSVQQRNIHTVACCIDLLIDRNLLGVDDSVTPEILNIMRHTASLTGLRGRWEVLSESPEIICDIGHNENALTPVMAQLRKLFELLHPSQFFIIFGMASDKDIESVRHLLPQDARYIFTNAKGSRAMPAESLRRIVTQEWGEDRCDLVSQSVEEAVRIFYGIASDDSLLYIGGSSYVVAEAIPIVEEYKNLSQDSC